MGDNEFRSLRRSPVDSSADLDHEITDPLAELARLIGQSASHGAVGRADEAADAEAPRAPHWGDEEHAGPGREPPPEARYDHSLAASGQYSPLFPGNAHDDAHDEPYRDGAEEHAAYDDEPPQSGDQDAGDLDAGDESFGDEGVAREDAGDYSDAGYDERYDEPYEEERSATPRRSRTGSLVLGIVGLIALGSAGAFGYRAMFGGGAFPALPPIIKPSGTPVKIVPNHDSQAAASNQTALANADAGEHLVSHEEQPVDVKPATPDPKGVTTLPVISNTPPEGVLPGTQPPDTAAPGGEATGTATSAEGEAAGAATPSAPPPKPVHTLAIHTDRSAPGNPAAPRERSARVGQAAGPLSITPGGQIDTPFPSRTRHAAATQASPPSAAPLAQTGSMTGGYAVQVSAQRSEADAQATLNALQTKYPQQLRGQHGMVRRADLGAKGIYYRALVGPFGSAEEASRLCSSLKAAGGNCIIQRI
jgi:hypothetical protein